MGRCNDGGGGYLNRPMGMASKKRPMGRQSTEEGSRKYVLEGSFEENTRAGPTDATELFDDEKQRVWNHTWLVGGSHAN